MNKGVDKFVAIYDELKLNGHNLSEMEYQAFCINGNILDCREQLVLEYGKLSSYLAFDSGYGYNTYQRLYSILNGISEKIDDFNNLTKEDILVLKKIIVYLNLDLGLSVSFYSTFEEMILSDEFNYIKNNLKREYDFDSLCDVMMHKEKEKMINTNNILDIPAVPVNKYNKVKQRYEVKQNKIGHYEAMRLYIENQVKQSLDQNKPRISLAKKVGGFNKRLFYIKNLLERNSTKIDDSSRKMYLKLLLSYVNKDNYSIVNEEQYIFARKIKTFLESKVGIGISDIEMYINMMNSGELNIDISKLDNEEDLLTHLEEEFGLTKKEKRR